MAGGFILENIPGLTVDVHNPQVVVHVEIRAHDVFVYSTSIPGPGVCRLEVTGRGFDAVRRY